MKTTAVLTSVLAFVSSASALSCYPAGETHSVSQAKYHAGRACRGYDGKAGAFQGRFAPGQTRRACVDTPGAVKYEMSITNTNKVNYDLNDNDCAWRLEEIINECKCGGVQTVAGWDFYFDPNSGRC